MTRPWSLYLSYHASRYGAVLRQLMQVYVQKSIRTTFLPIRFFSLNGSVLMNCPPGTSSTAGWYFRAFSFRTCVRSDEMGVVMAIGEPLTAGGFELWIYQMTPMMIVSAKSK